MLPLNEDGGALAFAAIIGLCVIGFQVSYGLPILIKLIYNPVIPMTDMDLGVWSRPFGVLSCVWLFGTSCLLFFPVENPVEPSTMNWLIVVVAGVFLAGMVNWQVNSKYHFTGPPRHEDNLLISNLGKTAADVAEYVA